MRTTIEIPEKLYQKAHVRAVELGVSLSQIVLTSLERELAMPSDRHDPAVNYWANRTLRPGYAAALQSNAFTNCPDSTDLISEDRSSREDALL